jgi:hypothetical protein
MDENKSDIDIKSDVLHSDNPSKLTPEEIAKAVAHHNRNHPKDHSENAPAKGDQRKKQVEQKRK